MSRTVTLEISDSAVRQAQEAASRTDRRVEDVLAEWIDRLAADPPVESLPNEEVLTLCRSELGDRLQSEMSDLLVRQREGALSSGDEARLSEVMNVYRRGLVRKAQALQIAVERQLIPRLT
jgi:hypothetical protein